MRIADVLRDAAKQLNAVSDTPRLDAELLMAEALSCERSVLLLRHMQDAAPAGFAVLLARRLGHEPMAHIRGRQQFWSLDLVVTPDVLIPRPDSETLIELAVKSYADAPPASIVDLGTGSGALLLAALSEFPEARGIGIDASPAALAVAEGNAGRLGLASRARFRLADWREPDWIGCPPADLLLANPPYVETGAELAPGVRDHEPHAALFAGADGLDAYRILVPALPRLVRRGGLALFEIGMGQGAALRALAAACNLTATIHPDLAGRDRVAAIRCESAIFPVA